VCKLAGAPLPVDDTFQCISEKRFVGYIFENGSQNVHAYYSIKQLKQLESRKKEKKIYLTPNLIKPLGTTL
jgi:hypothetical protein